MRCQSSQIKSNKTVAVITTTIGRVELEKAILSVQAQTYPCKHYVFVDGKAHWHKVAHLVEKYPQVIFTFLPMNTGGKNNIGNGAIHAIAPYLLEEDVFCFLDDDNWHDPDHVEHLVKMLAEYQLDYAYSLRKLYDKNYQFVCDDDSESIGFWQITEPISVEVEGITHCFRGLRFLIDTNSYAITREMSFKLCQQWISGISNDHNVFNELLRLNARGGCTGKRTTHYKLNLRITDNKVEIPDTVINEIIKQRNKWVLEHKVCEWHKPTLLIDGKLISL